MTGGERMKIAVIGAGAMGSIYGGMLSQEHEVYLIDTNQAVGDIIADQGIRLLEQEGERSFYPNARVNAEGIGPCELVIVFVKSLYSRAALQSACALIGSHTYVMTLQNGAGHETILQEFVSKDRIIIGTTEDNGAVITAGVVRHGGQGKTNIGMVAEDREGMLVKIRDCFHGCGFDVKIHTNIMQLIWEKLLTNVSLSAVTGILQVDMGYAAGNEYAWNLTKTLLHEAVLTARAMGLVFDEEKEREKIRNVSLSNPQGVTSIRADLRDGRRTEVDTISGAVVRAAKVYGVEVPCHEFVVAIIHAMEGRMGI